MRHFSMIYSMRKTLTEEIFITLKPITIRRALEWPTLTTQWFPEKKAYVGTMTRTKTKTKSPQGAGLWVVRT